MLMLYAQFADPATLRAGMAKVDYADLKTT
jgi:hypothetical protein